MAENRGKQFETVIKESFEKVPNVSVDRLHDQTTGYLGSKNIADFIVYRYPYQFYIECKSVHGNTLPLTNITDNQYSGMIEKAKIPGVYAGVLCWFIDKDVTLFVPIEAIRFMKGMFIKSIRYDADELFEFAGHAKVSKLVGTKKRVFFDYDMQKFFDEVTNYDN